MNDEYRGRFADVRCLAVVAAGGAGKTIQAQLYARAGDIPLAWLSLDRSDGSAPRLLVGLAACLDGADGARTTAVRDALRADHTADEVAAILGDSLPPDRRLLVLDECSHVYASEEAASALGVFLEYAPAETQVMLLSRTDVAWPLRRGLIEGSMSVITESVLNFTRDEVRDLVGHSDEADLLHDATGGWAAGVILGARSGFPTVAGMPEVKDFVAYLGTQLLDRLPERERAFLLDSSVAAVMTREVATALAGGEGHALWDWLSAQHLPATTSTGAAITYHSLFRTFLAEQLLARAPARHPLVVRRYATYLASVGRFEEATELLLGSGDMDAAGQVAAQAAFSLYGRADWPTLHRWVEVLGPDIVLANPLLLAASIRALHGTRRFEHVIDLIRRLDQRGGLREATDADPGLLATVAWAMQAEPRVAQRLLRKYRGDYRAEAVSFMLDAATGVTPAAPVLGSDWADVERHITWGLILQGRLSELDRLVPQDGDTAVINPNVIISPVLRGEQAKARALWRRVPPELRTRPQSRFIESFMLMSEGRMGEALATARRAVEDSRKTHFSLTAVYEVYTAYILLNLDRADDAVAMLDGVINGLSNRGETAILEWAQAFLGLAYLRAGRTREAQLILREAVRSMQTAQRRLFLPAAAACLSEAAHQAGDTHESGEMAKLAYHTASLIGSFNGLLEVIRMFPTILEREIARDPADTRWRRLFFSASAVGLTRLVSEPRADQPIYLSVQPFGLERDILFNGDRLNVGRIKIIELAAYLALHPRGVDRTKLQQELFPEASQRNGGNHFRQIIHKFTRATGIALVRQGRNQLAVQDGVWIEAVDVRFEQLLHTTSVVPGPERVQRLGEALALINGRYLESSSLQWAEERRQQIEIMEEEARLELVTLLIEQGDPIAAREECEALLALNRFCDPAYRLLLTVERSVGSESSCLAVYRRAAAALKELGLEPGYARQLLSMSSPALAVHEQA
ncbi:BTAD domain-containing putative transcriptional regulator [Acrocarpospora macrocephala]|uniref:BTAD domain-containing putative transcriptional regulator n=1 Tax=Acrocarpospora macrocephala TaxID=150177 RepID=UPI0012D3596F|nr:BTAD domain-containing putative transcriptional regulator [Acrocarpospora macrocephala]